MDYWFRFMDIYIRWPGSVHVYIFTNTDLFAKEKKVPFCQIQGEWLMPAAYRYWFWVITPIHYFPGPIHYNLYTSLVNEGLLWEWISDCEAAAFQLPRNLAACCTMHNLCEVYGGFDEDEVFASAEIPSSGAAGMTSTGSNNTESIHRWIRTGSYRNHLIRKL